MIHRDARILIEAIEKTGAELKPYEQKCIKDIRQRFASGYPIMKGESIMLQECYRRTSPSK